MIYLNDIFKNAGTINESRTSQRDIEINPKINQEIIKKLFLDYSIIPNKGIVDGWAFLRIRETIINIYKNRNEIF